MKNKIQIHLLAILIAVSGATVSMYATANSNKISKSILKNRDISDAKTLTLEVFKNGKRVDAFWSTCNESNGSYYTLERSKNGKEFEQVSFVYVANISNNIIEYVETDYQPLNGVSYYRLKRTDSKNSDTYSNTVIINYTSDNSVTNRQIKSLNNCETINNLTRREALVLLRNETGKEFYTKVLVSIENMDIIGYDIENNIAPGIYLITGASNNTLYGQKLIVRQYVN